MCSDHITKAFWQRLHSAVTLIDLDTSECNFLRLFEKSKNTTVYSTGATFIFFTQMWVFLVIQYSPSDCGYD